MGFFRRLLGGDKKGKSQRYIDTTGVYFYFQCDNCGTRVRVRADKQHDLLSEDDGYVWHKTVVDSKCFRRMQTVVHLDHHYHVTSYELHGGQFLTQAAYEAAEAAAQAKGDQPPDEQEGASKS